VASRVDIVRSDVNGITWIALDGELDMARANEAGPELMAVCDGAAHAVLDTRALRFIDLAGLRLLSALWQRQRARGARLSIVPGGQVRRLAELAGMTEPLQGASTPDELLGLKGGPPPPRGAHPDLALTSDLSGHVERAGRVVMNEELQSTNEEMHTANDELRERSAELQAANTYLASILSGLHAGVIVVDGDLVVRVWNLWSEDEWGLRSDDVVGKNVLALDFGLPVQELGGPLRRVVTAQGHEERAVEAVNRRGRRVRLRVDLTSLPLADGRLGAMLLAHEEDIPEHGDAHSPEGGEG
jgi:anti-anti-sigma factor